MQVYHWPVNKGAIGFSIAHLVGVRFTVPILSKLIPSMTRFPGL